MILGENFYYFQDKYNDLLLIDNELIVKHKLAKKKHIPIYLYIH